MSKPNRGTIVRGIVIFILLPVLLGVIMYIRMLSVIHTHLEDQVTAQARSLGQLALRRVSVRMSELELVASYLGESDLSEREMCEVAEGLLDNSSQITNGIVRLDGRAVNGVFFPLADYPAIRSSFRGNSAVRYREGEGLLLTTPVFHNGNVKYVLYQFFDIDSLFEGFVIDAFGGGAGLMLVDGGQQIAIPISEKGLMEDDPFFNDPSVQEAIAALSKRLNTDTTATVYCSSGMDHRSQEFIFVSVLGQTGMYLMGIVPHEAAAGQLSSLSVMAVLVFALLLALLTIGTFRMVSADARARESDALRRAKRLAEEASESKGRFLSSMSHELRTPINTIMGMNEMILRETTEQDTRERAMDVRSAAQILLSLINDVLDFSKIESGKLSIIPVEYDLTKLVRDLELLSENRARAKSLDFRLDISPDLPVGLFGDDIRIQQVLTNLLTNAVKYTPEGVVTLSMDGDRTGDDTIVLHCRVIDTGMGIKPEDVQRLKELSPFTRVDEARNRNVEGSGLGLPIIINLLRLMGSELQIESVYGKGSTFSFDLEQKISDPTPVGDIRKRIDENEKAYEYKVTCYAPAAHVLVVDDNAMNRKIFISLLKPTGIQVSAASSGAKCLEMVKHERYDLIFMDHLMPEMDGVETLHRLKEQEENLCRDVPVIALTANAFSGAQEKYMAMGFDAFLAKPIVTERLESMLLDMLPKEYLETPPAAAPAEPQSDLPAIDGVHWDFALLHIDDHDLLMESLRDFYKSLGAESRELAELAEHTDTEEGLTAYRTRVHSLKSTAAMVGVLTVSELARVLETAAREGDRERIAALDPVLRDTMSRTEEQMRPFMGKGPDKEPLDDPSQLVVLLEMLQDALGGMDISVSDAITDRIDHFIYDPEMQEQIDELVSLESALDFEGAAELTKKLLEQLG